MPQPDAGQPSEEFDPSNKNLNDPARVAYQSLIYNTRTLEFSGFARNQRQQYGTAREKGRAAALHFLSNGQISITPFCDSLALQKYLDAGTSADVYHGNPSTGVRQPLRRMILLEDLPRNHIEVLGSRLRIHPSFFAAHYSDPIKTGSAAKGLTLGQPSRGSFVLQSPQMHYMVVNDQKLDGGGLIYRGNSHVRRSIMKGVKESAADLAACFGEMWNVISFWSVEHGNGDWTAVVIVDPPLGDEIRHVDKGELRKITITEGDPATGFGMQYPSLTAKKDLPDDIDNWNTPEPSPNMQSVFEETLHAYSSGKHPVTDDPTSCTTIIRRITLSMWIGYLDRMRYVLNNTHKQLHGGNENALLWHDWLFQDLIALKADLEYILIFLYRNLKVLQVRLSGTSRSGMIDEWEADEWRLAEARFSSLRRDVDGIASIYAHAASLEAIRTANEQSSSVGRLTTLATVFLPLGLVAGIFSIGGEYAVGASRFWVFFAVTVPLGITIALLLFTNIAPKVGSKVTPHLQSLQNTLSIRHSRSEGNGTDDMILPQFNKAHN
ncbi:hypothetical protein BKA61DRAFT_574213 [Leptodontidium sp. MPI-SDFR-AT-0119]|nr:hypothetical protein BKA61DRAFT_574213 [Leptodontidium sp. MPI-SDFR-AT-0119]